MNVNPLRCAECGSDVPTAVTKKTTEGKSLLDAKVEKIVDFWWCRDCMQGVCKNCHLMKGHTEHRTNEWRPEEVYRCCVQALEGRCSRRNKVIHDQKIAIKEFVAKVEVVLLNELGRHLEQNNEPDRRLISRINRALTTAEMSDERPNLYHLPSPSRPAWKNWNLDQEDPSKMAELIEMTSELLQLPREDYYEQELTINDKSEWNPRRAAELIAHSMGARISLDTHSNYSRSMTPERGFNGGSSSMLNGEDSRRRAGSVDSHRNKMPLEPSVFVRAGPSVMSFRERSIPSDETNTFNDSVGSPVLSHVSFDSKPGSAMSSIPAYPCDQSLASMTPSQSQAVTPTPNMNGGVVNGGHRRQRAFGSRYLTRPICVQAFSTSSHKDKLAVSDSCGGVYITNTDGEIEDHVQIKNSSASSVAIDEKNNLLYVSVMQAKGRSIHVFDIASNFKKMEVLQCPKDPKIEMSRTRWITVAPRGQLFMVSGDNVKSALWCYVRGRKGWKTIKESRKTRYQYLAVAEDQAEYKAVVLLTCDAANNRLLLFVIDHTHSLINEYDLSKTYRLPEHISSPASAIVDGHGNLLVLDYATGKVWILLSGVKGIRRLKEVHFEEPVNAQEALGITVLGDDIYVACFGQREVRTSRYLENGVFLNSPSHNNRSPSLGRRSASVPRPPESRV